MQEYSLEQLGPRICVLGPSNSGKSTLSVALGRKTGIPVYHMDQIVHVPKSSYTFRPAEDWVADHDKIIEEPSWVIDGNYSACMRQRFSKATGIIQLNPNRLGAVARFIARSIKRDPNRPGALKDAAAEFSWRRVHFTLFEYPKFKGKHDELMKEFNHLNIVRVGSMSELNRCYQYWGLNIL